MVPLKSFFRKSSAMDVDSPITLHNRHTGGTEIEQVYGEAWLRRIYGNPLGKVTLHTVVKRALFSKIYGWAMDRPGSARRVAPFIRDFGLELTELEGLRQRGEATLGGGQVEARADDVGLDLGLDGLGCLLERALLGHDERGEEKRDKGQARHGEKTVLTDKWFP